MQNDFPDKSELGKTRICIIVSTGRTGTAWIAKLINSSLGVHAVHEPIMHEQIAHAEALSRPESIEKYANFRIRYINAQCAKGSWDVYVEVNGALRRHVHAIKNICPQIYMPHVIRDGRDVVSSIMNRPKSLTIRDPCYFFVNGHVADIDNQWSKLSKFEKACCLWNSDNEYMSKYCDATIKFEEMLSDYDKFVEILCDPIGILIERDKWKKSLNQIENSNKKITFPKWEHWSSKEKSAFFEICGKTMEKYGYDMEQ